MSDTDGNFDDVSTAGFTVSTGGEIDATELHDDPTADIAADGEELEGTTGGLA